MSQQRTSHILNAASNLLGIALVIIAGLNVSHAARNGIADEIAWVAAICLGASCFMSYVALREEQVRRTRAEKWADRVFLLGLLALIASIVVLAFESR
jgi:predicted transporter